MASNFGGLRVLSLESRRAKEMGQLIGNYGGKPMVAPSTREVPAGPNDAELKFAADLQQDKFGAVILLTGVGTRALALAIESVMPREQLVAALGRTKVVARGPKPMAVLREFGVPVALAVPEPNTWREILQALDQNAGKIPLKGQLVAVQEYGVPSPELYAGLEERGAKCFPCPSTPGSRLKTPGRCAKPFRPSAGTKSMSPCSLRRCRSITCFNSPKR